MIQTGSEFDQTARSHAYGQLALAELRLRSGTARFTTWPVDVEILGETWTGVGSLGSIGSLHESEDGGEEKLTLTFSAANFGTRALALGDPNDYKDKPVLVRLCLLDPISHVVVGTPVLRFAGAMDQLKVERNGPKASIALDCRTASYDVRSNPAGLRLNHAQHQARHPGERGFEYLTSLIGNPAVWVSKSLQARLNEIARAKG